LHWCQFKQGFIIDYVSTNRQLEIIKTSLIKGETPTRLKKGEIDKKMRTLSSKMHKMKYSDIYQNRIIQNRMESHNRHKI